MESMERVRSVLGRARRRVLGGPERGLRHPASRDLGSRLLALGDRREDAIPLLRDLEARLDSPDTRDLLIRLLETHPRPHHVNRLLAEDEMARGSTELVSFPVNVWMDLSNVCTVQCRFCKYVHKHHKPAHLSLEHVQSIEWLKYTSLLNMSAGTAESIANPNFPRIFEWLRSAYPHLHLTLLSNGKTLDERISSVLRGKLDHLHISMNAGNREDYERVIKDGNWDRFSRNLRRMKELFSDADRPFVTGSFVMMRWNVDRAVEYLEFAHEHGADEVLFHHYYVPYIRDLHEGNPGVLGDKFPKEESLYFEPERSDEVFARVVERAAELGVRVHVPPPFSRGTGPVLFGVRAHDAPPEDCSYPWTNLYLLWGFKSRREEVTICCGMASDLGVFFDRDEIATVDGLRRTWNAPTLQAYRRTVNGSRMNPICLKCRKVDRFDPRSEYPHQAEFFEYCDLPVPEHHRRQAPTAVLSLTQKPAPGPSQAQG